VVWVRSCDARDVNSLDLPDDLPVIERSVVRVVALDAAGRVLLFHTRDPTYPELGSWWELPGGGIERDETALEAAVRELREETGIVALAADIGPPTWRRRSTFRYRGERRLQHESVVTIRIAGVAPAVDGALRVGFEHEDYVDHRWWTVPEISASQERFYPGRLPEFIVPFLAGDQIDEPFEAWS